MPLPKSIPVVIVGGGPVGLTASLLLSYHGVDHILVERNAGTTTHPKAVGLNQRAMEIFQKVGVGEQIVSHAAFQRNTRRNGYYTNIGPHGRELGNRDGFGAGRCAPAYVNASPSPYVNIPQVRLEPILKQRAEVVNPDGLYWHHEVQSVTERSDDLVDVVVRDRNSDVTRNVVARYVIAADGGKSLLGVVGAELYGQKDIVDMVTIHVRAPFSQYHPDPTVFMSWLVDPAKGASLDTGVLYHLGPYPLSAATEEWAYVLPRPPHQRGTCLSEDECMAHVRSSTGLPDLPVEVLDVGYWEVHATVANVYDSPGGHVYLVGDAAHKIPPFRRLGLSTGILDVDNLTWKLAWALNRPSLDLTQLLASYDAERRPLGIEVAKRTAQTMFDMIAVLDQAIGISPSAGREANERAMDEYFNVLATDDENQPPRRGSSPGLLLLEAELYTHGEEVGWFYANEYFRRTEATWRSPQLREDGRFDEGIYHASTVPGHQLPHAWLRMSGDDERSSTRHLLVPDRFLLVASSPSWDVINHGLVKVECVGRSTDLDEDSWIDVNERWAQQRQVSETGAVLVRPDGIVAYRWVDDSILRRPGAEKEIDRVVKMALLIDYAW